MINLIPTSAKKTVVTEYWVRTVSLWSLLFGTVLILIAVLFIPLNIYVLNQERYLSNILASQEEEKNNHEQNSALLLRANEQAKILAVKKYEYKMLDLLPLLEKVAESKVNIKSVTINQSKEPSLSVSGEALTRQSLVAFRDELEKTPEFLEVDLPINNLIEDVDVDFTISIALATTTDI